MKIYLFEEDPKSSKIAIIVKLFALNPDIIYVDYQSKRNKEFFKYYPLAKFPALDQNG